MTLEEKMQQYYKDRGKVSTPEIETAEHACWLAHTSNPNAAAWWCGHHGVRLEPPFELANDRIDFIVMNKATDELVARLQNFRPFAGELPKPLRKAANNLFKATANRDRARAVKVCEIIKRAYAMDRDRKANARVERSLAAWIKVCDDNAELIDRMHREQVPHHTWNGRDIFGPEG